MTVAVQPREARRVCASTSQRLMRDLPLIGYSAGNFGKNLLLSGFDVTLLFMLTDLLGIAPSIASALMLFVFVGDLFFDVGAGYFASLARARGFGYRWMISIGAIPCGVSFALLYSLPALHLRGAGMVAGTLLMFRAAYAFIDVPHNSLLARVANDSHSRGRASGYRLFFSSLASLAVAIVFAPSVVAAAQSSMASQLSLLSIMGACLCCIALWIAAWSSGGDALQCDRSSQAARIALLPQKDPLLAGIAVVAIVTGFAMPMFGRMVIYFSTYVLDRPGLASRILLAMTLGQFPGVLFWTVCIRFTEKTTLLSASYLLTSAAIALFAVEGNGPGVLVCVAVGIGFGLAGVFMLPWAILADVIDFAEFRHGQRRETATFAAILVLLKAGGAASVGTVGLVLSELGYRPGLTQPESVQVGIRVLAFGVPLLGSMAAICVLRRMAVGHSRHARIVRALQARRSTRDPGDPSGPPA